MRPLFSWCLLCVLHAASGFNNITVSSQSSAALTQNNASPLSNVRFSVRSHRILDDIVVVPSNRRLYMLVVMPVHESRNYQGYECGEVDINGFIKLAAFLKALAEVNANKAILPGIDLGAIVIDSCASDLRTVADFYELLAGTNIERKDIVAIVRADRTEMINFDALSRYFRLPTVNAYITPSLMVRDGFTAGTLPSDAAIVTAIADLLVAMEWSCVNILFDGAAMYAETAMLMRTVAEQRKLCVNENIVFNGAPTANTAQLAIRKLLLSEARVVIVFASDRTLLQLIAALRAEQVNHQRFMFIIEQSERWSNSRTFDAAWRDFDQLLFSITNRRFVRTNKFATYMNELTSSFPHFPFPRRWFQEFWQSAVRTNKFATYMNELTSSFPHFPFPRRWFQEFWQSAFECHFSSGSADTVASQYSRPCSPSERLNLTEVVADINVLPTVLSVEAVARGVQKLMESRCPGTLVQTLSDCLNNPEQPLIDAIKNLRFEHWLSPETIAFDGQGFRPAELTLHRVRIEGQILVTEHVGSWSQATGLIYDPNAVLLEERNGKKMRLLSSCKNSHCARAANLTATLATRPSFAAGLNNVGTLVFAAFASLWASVCLMCIYHQIASQVFADDDRSCILVVLTGLAMVSLVSMFFMMPPSLFTCAVRRVCLGFAWAFVLAPLLVRTISAWRQIVLYRGKKVRFREPEHKSSALALFYISIGLALVQMVLAIEWAVLESPTNLAYATYNEETSWRCAPGIDFEQRLIASLAFCGVLACVTMLCCFATCNQSTEHRYTFVVCLIPTATAVALYFTLPLARLPARDPIMAIALLVNAIVILVLIYARPVYKKQAETKQYGEDPEMIPGHATFWMNKHMLSQQTILALPSVGGKTIQYEGGSEFCPPPPAVPPRPSSRHTYNSTPTPSYHVSLAED
uniref:G-protein coupled receptors family 3 profile domain-containing protein n=1 Tax=Plectus sambesii TaxID=2011161 RepID=A0A914XKV2_9BILA